METSESLRTGRLSVVLPAYNEEESVPLAEICSPRPASTTS